MNREKAVLHFSRFRPGGNADFFDPQTDMRRILPSVLTQVASDLEQNAADEATRRDAQYILSCVRVFQIRVLEDNTELTEQVREFLSAINKTTGPVRMIWYQWVVQSMMCIYSLFCRRDSSTDSRTLKSMLNYAHLSTLKNFLTCGQSAESDGNPTGKTTVDAEIERVASLLDITDIHGDGTIVCHETGEEIPYVKELAARFIEASGDQSWEAKAAACDREFESGRHSDRDSTVLALAYPTYENPCVTVEVCTDGLQDKAEEPQHRD